MGNTVKSKKRKAVGVKISSRPCLLFIRHTDVVIFIVKRDSWESRSSPCHSLVQVKQRALSSRLIARPHQVEGSLLHWACSEIAAYRFGFPWMGLLDEERQIEVCSRSTVLSPHSTVSVSLLSFLRPFNLAGFDPPEPWRSAVDWGVLCGDVPSKSDSGDSSDKNTSPLLPVLSSADMLFTMCNLSIGDQALTLTLLKVRSVSTASLVRHVDTIELGVKVP